MLLKLEYNKINNLIYIVVLLISLFLFKSVIYPYVCLLYLPFFFIYIYIYIYILFKTLNQMKNVYIFRNVYSVSYTTNYDLSFYQKKKKNYDLSLFG